MLVIGAARGTPSTQGAIAQDACAVMNWRGEASVIRVALETLVMGNVPGASLLILRPLVDEPMNDRILPICIGPVEAAAIGKALSDEKDSRPMTHSLICTVIGTLGGKLLRVCIPRVKGTIFYASLHIQQGDSLLKVDARPSDAIAIALRMDVPVYVSESVMESAGYPAWVNIKSEQDRAEMEQFHKFVETVTPDDFRTESMRHNGEDGE